MKPCFEVCQCCEYWDDINGCWANKEYACVDEDGEFEGLKL